MNDIHPFLSPLHISLWGDIFIGFFLLSVFVVIGIFIRRWFFLVDSFDEDVSQDLDFEELVRLARKSILEKNTTQAARILHFLFRAIIAKRYQVDVSSKNTSQILSHLHSTSRSLEEHETKLFDLLQQLHFGEKKQISHLNSTLQLLEAEMVDLK